MNRIEIKKIVSTTAVSTSENEIRIFIDGCDLIDMLKEFEKPFATREKAITIAGAYGGLPESVATRERFLGLADRDYGDSEDKVAVLGCNCGWEGCWPFTVKITISDSTVIWSEFEQPHSETNSAQVQWNYDGFGPFEFDKEHYLNEIGKLACNQVSGI